MLVATAHFDPHKVAIHAARAPTSSLSAW
jgi:hypothetical protein